MPFILNFLSFFMPMAITRKRGENLSYETLNLTRVAFQYCIAHHEVSNVVLECESFHPLFFFAMLSVVNNCEVGWLRRNSGARVTTLTLIRVAFEVYIVSNIMSNTKLFSSAESFPSIVFYFFHVGDNEKEHGYLGYDVTYDCNPNPN